MSVLIEISWRVARVVMVLARHLFLAGRIAMAVLIDVPWLVALMVVMLARLFLSHAEFLG